jgi:hypothetical protein
VVIRALAAPSGFADGGVEIVCVVHAAQNLDDLI